MKNQLINIVKEALDIEEETIDLNTQFDSLDTWDSLGKLSLIALIDESFNVQISDNRRFAHRFKIKKLMYGKS